MAKKKCKTCNKYFEQKYSTLQKCCSPKCAIEFSKETKRKQQESLNNAKLEKVKKDTLQALKNSVMNICHKFIRLRDTRKPCISCNANWNDKFQAGHFYKAELYSNLKYNEFNINGQCRKCNLRKDGNFEGYRKGFIERYGVDKLAEIDQLAIDYKHDNFKFDRQDLIDTRKKYNILYNKLK